MSSWGGTSAQSDIHRDSEELSRRRAGLQRHSALLSSRSAISHADTDVQEEAVVHVGDGRRATFIEHMMARMEQHGLRRCVCSEDPGTCYGVTATMSAVERMNDNETGRREEAANTPPQLSPPHEEEAKKAHAPVGVEEKERSNRSMAAAQPSRERRSVSDETSDSCRRSSSGANVDADAVARSLHRERYYYLCVPCELRLTEMSTQAATLAMLQDVHYHFASAAHRRLAAWMADADIDLTLMHTPYVQPVSYYARITINGVPMLLSRRPGGGDMFYPLPHEQKRMLPSEKDAASEANNECTERTKPPTSSCGHADESLSDTECHTAGVMALSRTETADRATLDAATRGSLFPYSGQHVYWYHPFRGLFTRCKQLVQRCTDDDVLSRPHRRLTLHGTRRALRLRHIPLSVYLRCTRLPVRRVPVYPMLVPLQPRRVPSAMRASAQRRPWSRSDRLHARATAASSLLSTTDDSNTNIADAIDAHTNNGDGGTGDVADEDGKTEQKGNRTESWCVMYEQCESAGVCVSSSRHNSDAGVSVWRCQVESEAAYRLVLLSAEEQGAWQRCASEQASQDAGVVRESSGCTGDGTLLRVVRRSDDKKDKGVSCSSGSAEDKLTAVMPLTRERLRQFAGGAWKRRGKGCFPFGGDGGSSIHSGMSNRNAAVDRKSRAYHKYSSPCSTSDVAVSAEEEACPRKRQRDVASLPALCSSSSSVLSSDVSSSLSSSSAASSESVSSSASSQTS